MINHESALAREIIHEHLTGAILMKQKGDFWKKTITFPYSFMKWATCQEQGGW